MNITCHFTYKTPKQESKWCEALTADNQKNNNAFDRLEWQVFDTFRDVTIEVTVEHPKVLSNRK